MKKSNIDPSNAIVLFGDLQAGIADIALTVETSKLQKSVSALSKLANIFEIPTIVTAVMGMDGSLAQIMPEVSAGTGVQLIHYRTTCNSFENDAIKSAIHDSGRKTLLISGVATEVVVQLAALSGVDLGYDVYVVIDACAGTSERTENAAIQRMTLAGVKLVSVLTLAGELSGDFSEPSAQQALGILFEMARG